MYTLPPALCVLRCSREGQPTVACTLLLSMDRIN